MLDDRRSVLVGVGELTDRPADPSLGQEPVALMDFALGRAADDAVDAAKRTELLLMINPLDVVNVASWRYDDSAHQLCERLGIGPRRAVFGPLGGESPVRLLHEAAIRVAREESTACVPLSMWRRAARS
ncbi:MAG: hypothetical protein CPSOU_6273 [uncultured Paraburkholderia sp.]|nr:MAG: hypothetical protein CPSOU_6273 [uncultured Paraburkholderia sp.]